MKKIVFYSWQSDLPNSTNRSFVQQALEKAVTNIVNDDTVAVEPVVDRDTKGVAGAPDIASTIFAKITSADVFVADVSIIAHPQDGRPTPNPNVLIELGYALKSLGHERIVLVFNNSFGKIEELPFDLRTRRLMTYTMSSEEKNRAPEKLKLEKQLEDAIRSALENTTEQESEQEIMPAIIAIEENKLNKVVIIRKNLAELLKKIDDLQPKKHSEGGTVDDLISSIASTQEIVAEFSKIIETVSLMKDLDSAIEIYKWFGNIFERYDYPNGHNGRTSNADHDYFKFIGHEMLVTMVAIYIREQRWDILKNVLDEPIIIKNIRYQQGPQNVYWDYASEHSALLLDESPKKGRLSIHSDMLNERHSSGGLSAIMPIEEFSSADFFLYILGEVVKKNYNPQDFIEWRPWSILYMKRVPVFIKNAEQKKCATKIAEIANLSEDEFKTRFKERFRSVTRLFSGGFWDLPDLDNDIDKIATR